MIEKLNSQEFNEYASSHPCNTFFQSSYWGELKELTGWKSHLLGIKENGKIICETLILSKKIPVLNKYIFYAPRGFLIDFKNFSLLKTFTSELKKYIKKNKGIFLKINPYIIHKERNQNGDIIPGGEDNEDIVMELKKLGYKHNGFTITYGKDLEPRWISVLDIKGKTEEELLKDMRSTTRWGINNSYKHGLELVEIDDTRIEEFKRLMEHTGERRGFIDRSLAYYKKMHQVFSKDNNIKIMLVELNVKQYLNNSNSQKEEIETKINELSVNTEGAKAKRILKELTSELSSVQNKIKDLEKILSTNGEKVVVAGGLFMTFGTQVISLFGASYREYMKYNGQYFLNFEMIKYALKNNYDKYNFLGITGDFDEKSPMFGLFDFKRGFNAKVVELVGEFTLITDSFFYKVYILMFRLYKILKKWRKK